MLRPEIDLLHHGSRHEMDHHGIQLLLFDMYFEGKLVIHYKEYLSTINNRCAELE